MSKLHVVSGPETSKPRKKYGKISSAELMVSDTHAVIELHFICMCKHVSKDPLCSTPILNISFQS